MFRHRIAPLLLAALLAGLSACTPLGGGRGSGASGSGGTGGSGVTVFGDIDAGVTRAK